MRRVSFNFVFVNRDSFAFRLLVFGNIYIYSNVNEHIVVGAGGSIDRDNFYSPFLL